MKNLCFGNAVVGFLVTAVFAFGVEIFAAGLVPSDAQFSKEATDYYAKYNQENRKAMNAQMGNFLGGKMAKMTGAGMSGKIYYSTALFETVVQFYQSKGFSVKVVNAKAEQVVQGFKGSIESQVKANPDMGKLVNLDAIRALNPSDFKGKTAKSAMVASPLIQIASGYVDPKSGQWQDKVMINVSE